MQIEPDETEIEDADLDEIETEGEELEESEGEESEQESEGEQDEAEGEEPEGFELDGNTYSAEQLQEALALKESIESNTATMNAERNQIEQERTQLQEAVNYVSNGYQVLEQLLGAVIPDEPPIELMQQDMQAYMMQKQQREQMVQFASNALNNAQSFNTGLTQQQQQEAQHRKSAEDQALISKRPELADPAKRAVFDKSIKDAATKLGFSEEELADTADHRVLIALGHVANDLKRSQNRKNAARRVNKVPTKIKGTQSPKQGTSNVKAMARLKKSGSIEDAIAALS